MNPQARRLARIIVQERQGRRLETTGQLAALIERWVPRHGKKKHPATRVFQALRMVVNDESRSLQSGLAAACSVLKPGGRLVVITFHSLEDRMVKEFGREQTRVLVKRHLRIQYLILQSFCRRNNTEFALHGTLH